MRQLPIVLIALVLVAAGCEKPPEQGMATESQSRTYMAHGTAPTVPVKAADGRMSTIEEMAGPIYIVGFIEPTGKDCCFLHPALVEMAGDVSLNNVSVVQISAPTPNCPKGAGCLARCNIERMNLIAICDADGIAHEAFLNPKPGKLYLIDEENLVVREGTIDNPNNITVKANEMGKDWGERQENTLRGS